MNLINLKIISPDGVKFDKNVINIQTKSVRGNIVLNYNKPNIAFILVDCISEIRLEDSSILKVLLTKGFVYCKQTEIKIFSSFYDEVSNVNITEIKKKIENLESFLVKFDTDSIDYYQLNHQLEIEKNKLLLLDSYKDK